MTEIPPAASDLRERAKTAVDDWIGDGTGWIDTELKELRDIIYKQFIAIRAEGEIKGWRAAATYLREKAPYQEAIWDAESLEDKANALERGEVK